MRQLDLDLHRLVKTGWLCVVEAKGRVSRGRRFHRDEADPAAGADSILQDLGLGDVTVLAKHELKIILAPCEGDAWHAKKRPHVR